MSAWKLSKDYKVSVKEAQGWIDSWFKDNPNIAKWLSNVRAKALKNGYIQIDLLGRKAWFSGHARYLQISKFLKFISDKQLEYLLPETTIKSLKRELMIIKGGIERQAGNFIVQGSCATITKVAQIHLRNKGFTNVLQVHDEILVKGKCEDELKDSMLYSWNLFNNKVTMPLKAEYEMRWKK